MTKRFELPVIEKEMVEPVLRRIKMNCVMCHECETEWAWNGGNKDTVYKATIELNFQRFRVRKAIWQIFNGFKVVGKKMRITTKCLNERCLNPELLVKIDQSTLLKRNYTNGLLGNAAHNAALLKARRARKDNKMSIEKARELRESGLDSTQGAEQYGISVTMAQHILANRYWKDTQNPFAGLIR